MVHLRGERVSRRRYAVHARGTIEHVLHGYQRTLRRTNGQHRGQRWGGRGAAGRLHEGHYRRHLHGLGWHVADCPAKAGGSVRRIPESGAAVVAVAHITLTSATESGSDPMAARTVSGWTRPRWSTCSQVTLAPSWASRKSTQSMTAWCSTMLTRMRTRRGSASRRAQKVPLRARLSDSVPPEVNSTSDGRAPMAWAIASRDSSTTRRPRRPEVCRDEALPTIAICAVIASMASGSIGVVAPWSRYTKESGTQ